MLVRIEAKGQGEQVKGACWHVGTLARGNVIICTITPMSPCHLAHVSPQLKQVLGAGVEPAYLSAPEPKSCDNYR